jgi:hypothetical protein
MSLRVLHLKGLTPAGAGPTSSDEGVTGACIPNIDTAGRRQRLAAGIIEMVVGLGLLAVLLALHLHPLWRLALLFVFWGAGISFYQWHDHT